MLHLTIENKYGEKLALSKSPDYNLIKVTGLTPAPATINYSKLATKDGGIFNSSKVEPRNIVLYIQPTANVENSRVNIYKYIKSKQYIKLYVKNGLRNVWIEGYVESIEGDLYENPQVLQVSILCVDPYFKALEFNDYSLSNVTPVFEFPFTIENGETVSMSELSIATETNIHNAGDDETGVEIQLKVLGLALEPTIYNTTTNEHFTIEYELYAGDVVILNTKRGEKSLTLIREGVEINIINHMARGSKWFNLISGDNVFTYNAIHAPENIQVFVNVQALYEGV